MEKFTPYTPGNIDFWRTPPLANVIRQTSWWTISWKNRSKKKSYFNVKWSLHRCVTISLFRLFRNAPRNLFETCCIAFWLEATARLKCEICYNWSIHDELILYDSLFGWSSAIFLTKFSQSPFYYSKEISLKIERCE